MRPGVSGSGLGLVRPFASHVLDTTRFDSKIFGLPSSNLPIDLSAHVMCGDSSSARNLE